MAKSGIQHVVSAVPIPQTTFVSEEFHALIHGNSFPASPVERQLFYRDDLHIWYIYNGTAWVSLQAAAIDELNDIGDVNVPTPTEGDFIEWDSATSKWIKVAHKTDPNAHHTPTTRLQSKVREEIRDLTAIAGDVSYTGYGFKPTALECFAVEKTTNARSWCSSDSTKGSGGIYLDYGGDVKETPRIVMLNTASGDMAYASITSYDDDGFTLGWLKAGSPSGSGILSFRALR